MSETPALDKNEIEAFVAEGLVIFDRPLTWEMVGELLAVLAPQGADTPA